MRTIILIAFGCLAGVALGLSSGSEEDSIESMTELSPSHGIEDLPVISSSSLKASHSRQNSLGRNRKGSGNKDRVIYTLPRIRDFGPDDILCYPGDLQMHHPSCRCCGGWEWGKFGRKCATPTKVDCSDAYQQNRYRPLVKSY